jgi:hypothetical protein
MAGQPRLSWTDISSCHLSVLVPSATAKLLLLLLLLLVVVVVATCMLGWVVLPKVEAGWCCQMVLPPAITGGLNTPGARHHLIHLAASPHPPHRITSSPSPHHLIPLTASAAPHSSTPWSATSQREELSANRHT